MNRRLIIAGAVLLTTGVIGWWQWASSPVDNTETSEYTPRTETRAMNSWEAQFEWRRELTKNVNTGKVEKSDFQNLRRILANRGQSRSSFLTWEERGPDNIGGRCRAILIDRNNENIMYAGSVSGGLFKSTDKGNNWSEVTSYRDSLNRSVSSITQSMNGTIYVATGNTREEVFGSESSGANGLGLYYSTDDGATWQMVPGTETWDVINEVVADPNANDKIWVTCETGMGLKVIENASTISDADQVASGLPSTGNFEAFNMSANGSVMVAGYISAGVKTYVSKDGGATWFNASDNSNPNPIPSGGHGRVEYAVSPTTNSNGKYNIYALCATTSGGFNGAYMSDDSGDNWYEIAPSGSIPSLNIFGDNTQGTYDNIVTASPNDPDRAYFGGIDIWEWNKAQTSPPFGQFEQKTQWFASQASPVYAHADQHEMKWDSDGNLFIGNDGGIGQSPAGSFSGDVWIPMNKGFNVTQYYYIAYSKTGAVMGGAQDNGTTYNDGTGNTPLEFREVFGGDGFACDISFMNEDAIFASSQNGTVMRSDDRGNSWGDFFSSTLASIAPNTSFYTLFRLYEDPNDTDAPDSVMFLADSIMAPGDTARLLSQTFQFELEVELTDSLLWVDTLVSDGMSLPDSNFFAIHPTDGDTIWMGLDSFKVDVALDTLMVQDPYQSLFVFSAEPGNGIWLTREALRFSASPFWWKIDPGMGTPKYFEFSKDGNILYVGTWSGQVWRVKGLNTLYATEYDTGYVTNTPATLPFTVTTDQIYSTGAAITGISVDKNDPGHVAISLGGFGGSTKVLVSTDADVTTGTANFSSIQGNSTTTGLPVMPVYSVVMDRNNPDIVVVGTQVGIWATQNASDPNPTWEQCTEVGNVPVYDMRQDWRSFTDGSGKPGAIYAGTHGRGIWSTGSLLNIELPEYGGDAEKFSTELIIYPNPMSTQGQVSFELTERSDVEVSIFTLSGKKVRTISRTGMAEGQHLIELEPNKLSNGTYLVEVVAGNKKDVSRFIVSR